MLYNKIFIRRIEYMVDIFAMVTSHLHHHETEISRLNFKSRLLPTTFATRIFLFTLQVASLIQTTNYFREEI